MDASPAWLFAGLLVSSVGTGLFIFGRKQRRTPQALVGLALLVVPFFISSAVWMIGAGGASIALLWVMLRAGW